MDENTEISLHKKLSLILKIDWLAPNAHRPPQEQCKAQQEPAIKKDVAQTHMLVNKGIIIHDAKSAVQRHPQQSQ